MKALFITCLLSFLISTLGGQYLMGQKQIKDFFLPMEPQGSMVETGTWGINGQIWGDKNVSPRDILNGLEDATEKKWCYWDGGIVKADDGKYHMYASRWAQSFAHSTGWKDDSKAIHAVSNNINGPYIDKGLVYPNWNGGNSNWQNGRGHNITALRTHEGKYAVVTSEITFGEIFLSDSPDGPFEYQGRITYDPGDYTMGHIRYNNPADPTIYQHMSNVRIIRRPEGGYLLVARSTAPMYSPNSIMGPYKVMADRVFAKYTELEQGYNEDPTVWRSGGMYHIVYNHWPTATMHHFTSEDGISNWTYRGIALQKEVDKIFKYTDGTINDWKFVERPGAVVDEATGHVTHFMFSVIDVHKGSDGANDNHASKIVMVPFDGAAFDCYMQNIIRAEKGLVPIDCDKQQVEADAISSIACPASVKLEEEVAISVNYNATRELDLNVELISASSSAVEIISTSTIQIGKATKNINVTIPAHYQPGDYLWKVWIAPKGKGKQYLISEKTKAVTVIDPSLVPSSLSLTPIHDAYLQGTSPYNTNDLRVEAGKRTSYLMFDLSNVRGKITSAELTLAVGTDNGSGEVQIHLGNGTSWTESSISTSNAPSKGTLLGKLTGNYDLNKTYSFTLDKSAINAGGKLSLVVTHVSGNDISFASKETVGKEPVLKIEMSDVATWLTKEKTSMVKVSPNPFNDFIKINSAEIVKQVLIMDMTGKQMKQMDCNVNDLFISTVNLPTGMYILRIQTKDGGWITEKIIKL